MEALSELENLINSIENEEKSYNRFLLRNQQYAFKRSGRIYETASVILGRKAETGRNKSSDKGRKREESAVEKARRREREGKEQERLIESWAKSQDLWLNDYEDPDGNKADSLEDLMASQWIFLDRGSEATVYIYDENTVIKTMNLSHYDNNLFRAMDRIVLHNTLSPNTALEVVGFGRDSLGHFQIIALQPFIQGQELTDDEFVEFKRKLNSEEEGWHYVDNFKITDIAPYNILKYYNQQTGRNEYAIIDADYWIDVEDSDIDNSITDVNTSIQTYTTSQGEACGS
ncbi:MAG: hypothetical protein J5698_01195 [Bacteroidaceae bacterium]|nr:hypothetical protein [Bacteroidaceae bacterium]